MNYEGNRADTGSVMPIQKEAVYRIDPKSGKVNKVTDEIFKPNGLCFSPDYSKLSLPIQALPTIRGTQGNQGMERHCQEHPGGRQNLCFNET